MVALAPVVTHRYTLVMIPGPSNVLFMFLGSTARAVKRPDSRSRTVVIMVKATRAVMGLLIQTSYDVFLCLPKTYLSGDFRLQLFASLYHVGSVIPVYRI